MSEYDRNSWRQVPVPSEIYMLIKARGAQWLKAYTKGPVHVMVALEPYGFERELGVHFSISADGRYPTWDEMKDARYSLCPEVEYMVQVLPPLSEFGMLPGGNTFHWFEVPMNDELRWLFSGLGNWL